MGAEVVPNIIPLSEALRSSRKPTMTNRDEDENDTLCSTVTCSQTTEGASSIACADNSSPREFRKDSSNDVIHTTEHDCTTSSLGKEKEHFLFEKNILTVVLIPAVLITVYTFFGAVSPPTSVDITSSLLELASDASNWYMTVLEEYPVLTKALTTGIIQFIGDYAAQRYEQQQEEATTLHSKTAYDLRRGLSLFADGLLLSGPLLHYCFEWMEDVWPTGGDDGMTKPLATLCHVFVNDYVIDSIYIGLSFVFTGIVEGYSLAQVADIFRKDYGATVKASWLTSLGLIPVEILCFGYLSLSFRVLAMNFVDLLWGAIVSFYSHRSRRESPVQEETKSTAVVQ